MDYRVAASSELKACRQYITAEKNLSARNDELTKSLKILGALTARKTGTSDEFISQKLDELKTELNITRVMLNEARVKIENIRRALNTLSDEEQALLNHLISDNKTEFEDSLYEKFPMERSTLYRKRALALEQFTRALFGTVMT